MPDPKQELREMLSDFETAMLVTRTREGRFHARPMAIARSEPKGDLWFFSSIDSGKIDELRADDHCAAIMQSNRKQLVISGRAEIIRDRMSIDALWSDDYSIWFDDGKDDPSMTLIHLIAEEAEYWDSSAPTILRRVLDVARAAWYKQPVERKQVTTEHVDTPRSP